MEQSFSKLLRGSRFANFQKHLGQIIQQDPNNPYNYGLKRQLRLKKPSTAIRILSLDEEMNQTEFSDASLERDRVDLLEEMVHRSSKAQSTPVAGKNAWSYGDAQCAHGSAQQGVVVAGRIIGKCPQGFLVGVYGEVAFLPESEIPPKKFISNLDVTNKAAYLFRVASAKVNSAGTSEIILSLNNVKY